MSDDQTIITDIGDMSIFQSDDNEKKCCLVQYSGKSLGKRYELDGTDITLGRSPKSSIQLDEASISRMHARFFIDGDDVEIEDQGSSNGTFINDKKIGARTVVKDQDLVRLGSILFKFFSHNNIGGIIQDKIYRMATIDAGTQIFNKQYLMDSMESLFKQAKTFNNPLSIIYYDLDHFKKVNDTYGHNAGDKILKESAEIVKNVIRKDDIQGRFGGEEFIIVLPNTDAQTAADLAERIRIAVASHPFHLEQDVGSGRTLTEHTQTISIGVSELSPAMNSVAEFMDDADKKLYQSKQTGRNRVTV